MSLEKTISSNLENLAPRPIDIIAKKVWTTTPPKDPSNPSNIRRRSLTKLSDGELQAVENLKVMIHKLAYNANPKFHDAGQRCRALKALGVKLSEGWPWKNNQNLKEHGTPILVRTAEVFERRIFEEFKALKGKDVGKFEGHGIS